MKRIWCYLLVVMLVFLTTACNLRSDFALFYDTPEDINGLTVSVNQNANCCFVGSYEVTEYIENMEIIIPDEYEGIPITRIGGYFGRGVPTPFYIDVSKVFMNAPENSDYAGVYGDHISRFSINDEYTIEYIPFTLKLGKNISSVEYVAMDFYYPHINEDNSITFYHPMIKIECSEENEYFYSKDGKLYDRKTDELVSEFEYQVDRETVLDEFSFSLTWGVYGHSSYDSQTGKLVKTTDATCPEDYVTTMFFTENELFEIYMMLSLIDIESYPDSYDPFNAPDAEQIVMSEPSQTIVLNVNIGTSQKEIRCTNIALSSNGYNDKADDFVDTYQRIIDMITAKEECCSLPEYDFFYD